MYCKLQNLEEMIHSSYFFGFFVLHVWVILTVICDLYVVCPFGVLD